jgi:hypothetical protein
VFLPGFEGIDVIFPEQKMACGMLHAELHIQVPKLSVIGTEQLLGESE